MPDEWEDEEELTYLERGEACQISDVAEFIEKDCPTCGRFLFACSRGTDGIVGVRCRKCKRDHMYKLTPKRMKIGF